MKTSDLKLVPTMNAGVICPDASEVECIARQLEVNGFRIFAAEVRRLWQEVESLRGTRSNDRCPICGAIDCKAPNCGSRD